MKLLKCCIVCYNTVHSSRPATLDLSEECVTALFVQSFQRHVNNFSLASSQVKVSQSALTFHPNNDTGSQSVKLLVCASCREMLSSFNSSYGDIKCAEMKANWSLEQLANVIRFADYAPARRNMFDEGVKNLNKDEDNHANDDLVEVISTFRKRLQSQCRLQYKNQYPRVILMNSNFVDNSTENVIKYKGRLPLRTESTTDLITKALKNLSSLQLVLYLALFDFVPTDTTYTNISHTNFQADDNFEQREKKVKGSPLMEHKESVECSPPSPPSPISIATADNVVEYQWVPVDGVEISQINPQEEDITPVYIKLFQNVTNHCCSVCQFEFSSEKELEQHSATCSKTWNGLDTPVSICNVEIEQEPNEITNEENMQRNTTYTDESTKRYSCDQCDQRYKSAATLRWHKLVHLVIAANNFSCSGCGKKFIAKTLWEKHIRVHSGENPLTINLQASKCETGHRNCPRSTTRTKKYVIIGNKKIAAKHTCIFCQKVFKYRRQYLEHLHGEIKESAYWCHLCSRGFSQKSTRNKHLKSQVCQKKKQNAR